MRLALLLIGFFWFSLTASAQSWNQVIKAVASDRAANDQFGYSVAISGDYAIVGATLNARGQAGAAYILERNAANTWVEIKKLQSNDIAAGDVFGNAVAISGDYVIVGARLEDENASGTVTLNNAGSAYIFRKDEGGPNNWGQVRKLVASDRAPDDSFGQSVAISGDYAIVGAYYEGDNTTGLAGAAYVFRKDAGGADNWGEIRKLTASDRAQVDVFGQSVAISGDYAIVGAYLSDTDASGSNAVTDAGAAYIFRKDAGGADNWGQVRKLVANDRSVEAHFGYSVSISGEYAIVGALLDDQDANGGNPQTDAGSAYIFRKDAGGTDNWGQIRKIIAADRAAADRFGTSVSISGDYAIVGANLEDEDAAGGNTRLNAGSAYIFQKDTGGNNSWGQAQKIVAADRISNDSFGFAVSISGNRAIVGANGHDFDPNMNNFREGTGAVYVFEDPIPAPVISLSATPTNFGNVTAGSSSSIAYTLQNTGSATLTIAGISSSNAPTFSVQNAPTSLAAGASASFQVVFAPMAASCAAQSATITISSNDPSNPTLSFGVSGTSLPLPSVSVAVVPAATAEDDAAELTFTFTASVAPCTDIAINFSVSGTATFNDDYVYLRGAETFNGSAGTVKIPAGQTSASVVVQVRPDADVEPDETLTLTVENP
ncbi:MAG: choice-of-anchor D domain-containing protein [Bernardetiaceae bacterium]